MGWLSMHSPDPSFVAGDGLRRALELLMSPDGLTGDLPPGLPETGVGEALVLEMMSGRVL